MKLRLHPLYILLASIYIIIGQGYIFMCYFVAIVLHELGHMVVAKRVGALTKDITLYPFGGQINVELNNISTVDEVKIAIAGPLTNLIVATFLLAVFWLFPTSYEFLILFYYANLFDAFINLIPVYPLDGGRISYALLKRKFKKLTAKKICLISGYIVSFAIMVLSIIFIEVVGITLLVMSVFLIISLLELQMSSEFYNYNLIEKKLSIGKCYKIENILVCWDTPLYRLISVVKKDNYKIFHIANDENIIIKKLEEKEILEFAIKKDIYLPIKCLV